MEQTITAEQIHKDFYGAEERLYVEAIGLQTAVLTSMNDKSKRLKKLGFGKAKTVKECEQKEAKRKVSGHLIHVIEYFRTYYPQYKFITEEEVKKLCEKYGLLLGETSNYVGDVPEKNLRDIENFKLRKEDWKEVKETNWMDDYVLQYLQHQRRAYFSPIDPIGYKGLLGIDEGREDNKKKENPKHEQPAFKICAPKQDFQTSGWEVREGYKLVYDPIVLQPVSKEGIEGYLIVTAWGDEASDEMVVNQINN